GFNSFFNQGNFNIQVVIGIEPGVNGKPDAIVIQADEAYRWGWFFKYSFITSNCISNNFFCLIDIRAITQPDIKIKPAGIFATYVYDNLIKQLSVGDNDRP